MEKDWEGPRRVKVGPGEELPRYSSLPKVKVCLLGIRLITFCLSCITNS